MKKIIVTGNVGADAEKKASQNGEVFATFSIGVAVGTKQLPKTEWVNVSVNGKLVDVVLNYVKKGTKLLIEGNPVAKAYTNKSNEAVANITVYAHNIEFLSSKQDNQQNSEIPF